MSRPWFDPRVPPPEDCVLRPLLDRRAGETPRYGRPAGW